MVTAPDPQGNLRPKRVQVTTELPEYYQVLAEEDPDLLRDIVTETLGGEPPRWEELYGPAVANPKLLSPAQRRVAFARQMTGHGGHRDLQNADVPAAPAGSLNAVNTLFMAHPINGLDDLLYIVMFGAKPYARRTDTGALAAAVRDQIFRQDLALAALACRNADPAAAMAAAGAAFEGRTVSFADALGMYIHAFTSEVFQFQGGPVPDPWIRLSRGRQGLHQRLEFGPQTRTRTSSTTSSWPRASRKTRSPVATRSYATSRWAPSPRSAHPWRSRRRTSWFCRIRPARSAAATRRCAPASYGR